MLCTQIHTWPPSNPYHLILSPPPPLWEKAERNPGNLLLLTCSPTNTCTTCTIYKAGLLPSYTPVSFTNTALQYNRLSIICRTAEEELAIQCCSTHSPVLLTPRSLFWAGVSWIFLAERWVLVYSVRSYKAHSRSTASRASSAREGKVTDFKINKPYSHVRVMTA